MDTTEIKKLVVKIQQAAHELDDEMNKILYSLDEHDSHSVLFAKFGKESVDEIINQTQEIEQSISFFFSNRITKKQQTTMKHKLHLACGDEMLRPVLSYIKVTKQICITTNAHILAIVNTENVFGEQFTEELKDDAEIYIHSKHYAQLTKFSNRLALNDGSITGYNKKGETFICPFKTKEQLEGTYPDFERVIPNFDELGKDYCSLNAVSINPKLLLNLQSALGTDLPLTLYFSGGSHRPIIALEPNGDSLGLIMPCQITNELSDYTGYKPNKQQTK